MIELERLPPPLPSLSPPTPSPLQQQVEMERGQQAADGGVSVVVVAERWINGGGDSGEEWDPQAARQAAPQLTLQTSALVMPPFYPAGGNRAASGGGRAQGATNAEATSTVAAPPGKNRRLRLWIGKG